MVLQLTNREICDNPIIKVINDEATLGFYPFICSKAGLDSTGKIFDCTKINIAKDIQESWYDYIKSLNMDLVAFTMFLLDKGPKVDDNLSKGQVFISNEFLVKGE